MFNDLLRRAGNHKLLTAIFAVSEVFILGGWIWLAIALRGTDRPLIVHFNALGIELGSIWDISAIGFFAAFAVYINYLISMNLEEGDKFLGKLVAALSLGFAILIFIGFAAIIAVN